MRGLGGIDPNARKDEPIHVGSEGQLYMITFVDDGDGAFVPHYAAASHPACAE